MLPTSCEPRQPERVRERGKPQCAMQQNEEVNASTFTEIGMQGCVSLTSLRRYPLLHGGWATSVPIQESN